MDWSYWLGEINATEIGLTGSLFKLGFSALLGGLVGIERKQKGQIAGIRTFALISMGATLAMILSIWIPQEYLGKVENGDPGRIAAQVVTGIGFLGAGAILQQKGIVRGLTTAAGIWMTAMIGMSIGAGMYVVGAVAAVMIVTILKFIGSYEHRFNLGWENKAIRMEIKGLHPDIEGVKSVFWERNVQMVNMYVRFDYEAETTVVNFVVFVKGDTDMVSLLERIKAIQPDVRQIALTQEMSSK